MLGLIRRWRHDRFGNCKRTAKWSASHPTNCATWWPATRRPSSVWICRTVCVTGSAARSGPERTSSPRRSCRRERQPDIRVRRPARLRCGTGRPERRLLGCGAAPRRTLRRPITLNCEGQAAPRMPRRSLPPVSNPNLLSPVGRGQRLADEQALRAMRHFSNTLQWRWRQRGSGAAAQ